jgi:hypothetical protein
VGDGLGVDVRVGVGDTSGVAVSATGEGVVVGVTVGGAAAHRGQEMSCWSATAGAAVGGAGDGLFTAVAGGGGSGDVGFPSAVGGWGVGLAWAAGAAVAALVGSDC